jgi:hypothetical protein
MYIYTHTNAALGRVVMKYVALLCVVVGQP